MTSEVGLVCLLARSRRADSRRSGAESGTARLSWLLLWRKVLRAVLLLLAKHEHHSTCSNIQLRCKLFRSSDAEFTNSPL